MYKHNPPLSPQSPRIRPRSFLKLPHHLTYIQSQCEDLIYNNTNPRSGIDPLKYPILPPEFQNVTKRFILRWSSPRKCVTNPPKHQDDTAAPASGSPCHRDINTLLTTRNQLTSPLSPSLSSAHSKPASPPNWST